jgi:hypothetical protein
MDIMIIIIFTINIKYPTVSGFSSAYLPPCCLRVTTGAAYGPLTAWTERFPHSNLRQNRKGNEKKTIRKGMGKILKDEM